MPSCRPTSASTRTAYGRSRQSRRRSCPASTGSWSLSATRRGKQQPYRFAFLTTPDQKHIIVGDRIVPFGEHPLPEHRTHSPAARQRTLSRIRIEGSWNWSSSLTSSARIARLPRPTWKSSSRIFPMRASSSRTIRFRASIPQSVIAARIRRSASPSRLATPLSSSSPPPYLKGRRPCDGRWRNADPEQRSNQGWTRSGKSLGLRGIRRRQRRRSMPPCNSAKDLDISSVPTLGDQRPRSSRQRALRNYETDHRVPGKDRTASQSRDILVVAK